MILRTGWLALCWALLAWMPAWAAEADVACTPHVRAVQAARSDDGARPAQGWEPVTLPDLWTRRWPGYDGSVWYRIDWERGCADDQHFFVAILLQVFHQPFDARIEV